MSEAGVIGMVLENDPRRSRLVDAWAVRTLPPSHTTYAGCLSDLSHLQCLIT
jgi:hypothetical protein